MQDGMWQTAKAPQASQGEQPPPAKQRRRSGPRSATSVYLGVTKYKRTGRWESHIWWGDGYCPHRGGHGRSYHGHKKQKRGCQLHLGSFTHAADAGVAYDRAAIRFRGEAAVINFPENDYSKDMFMMEHGELPKRAFVQCLRAWAQELDTQAVPGAPIQLQAEDLITTEPASSAVLPPVHPNRHVKTHSSGWEAAATRQLEDARMTAALAEPLQPTRRSTRIHKRALAAERSDSSEAASQREVTPQSSPGSGQAPRSPCSPAPAQGSAPAESHEQRTTERLQPTPSRDTRQIYGWGAGSEHEDTILHEAAAAEIPALDALSLSQAVDERPPSWDPLEPGSPTSKPLGADDPPLACQHHPTSQLSVPPQLLQVSTCMCKSDPDAGLAPALGLQSIPGRQLGFQDVLHSTALPGMHAAGAGPGGGPLNGVNPIRVHHRRLRPTPFADQPCGVLELPCPNYPELLGSSVLVGPSRSEALDRSEGRQLRVLRSSRSWQEGGEKVQVRASTGNSCIPGVARREESWAAGLWNIEACHKASEAADGGSARCRSLCA